LYVGKKVPKRSFGLDSSDELRLVNIKLLWGIGALDFAHFADPDLTYHSFAGWL
jgi:hypothetical protein